MREPAAAVGAVDELAWALLGDRDQLGQRGRAKPGRGRDEHRRAAEEADRREVTRHLDRQIGGGARRCHESRERGNEQRVAVGRRACRKPRRYCATGTRLIDRQHLLAPDHREPVGDDPQNHVDRAARGGISDDFDRPGGEVLRVCGCCGDDHRERKAAASGETVKARVLKAHILLLLASVGRKALLLADAAYSRAPWASPLWRYSGKAREVDVRMIEPSCQGGIDLR